MFSGIFEEKSGSDGGDLRVLGSSVQTLIFGATDIEPLVTSICQYVAPNQQTNALTYTKALFLYL